MKINTMGIWGDLHHLINLQKLHEIRSTIRITKSCGYLALDGNITACIYKTGKVQIYGNKNIDKIQAIWGKTVSILNQVISLPNADKEAQIKFIVASETLPYTLNLHRIIESFPNESFEYEPEQFPGLIWKFSTGTCLLFTSGNIIITGPNSKEIILKTISVLREKIDALFL